MSRRSKLTADLNALRGEIKRSNPTRDSEKVSRSESSRAEPINQPEVERLLRELQSRLSEAAEGLDDTISNHPLASVGAAFLLGLAAGRLIKRV